MVLLLFSKSTVYRCGHALADTGLYTCGTEPNLWFVSAHSGDDPLSFLMGEVLRTSPGALCLPTPWIPHNLQGICPCKLVVAITKGYAPVRRADMGACLPPSPPLFIRERAKIGKTPADTFDSWKYGRLLSRELQVIPNVSRHHFALEARPSVLK